MLIQLQEKFDHSILKIEDTVSDKQYVQITITNSNDLTDSFTAVANVHDLHGALTAFIESKKTLKLSQ